MRPRKLPTVLVFFTLWCCHGFRTALPQWHSRALAATAGFKVGSDSGDGELAEALLAASTSTSQTSDRDYYLSREQYSLPQFWNAFYTPDEEGESEAGDEYDWFFGEADAFVGGDSVRI